MALTRQESFEGIEAGPLEALMRLFETPKKTHLDVYREILRRWILKAPYNINMGCYEVMANKIGLEPDIIKNKVKTLDRAGFIDVNHWTLYPCFKLHNGVKNEDLAGALEKYRESIDIEKNKKRTIKNPNALWNMMMNICPKTKQYIDLSLCETNRWPQCKTCKLRIKNAKKKGGE
jgi:hypothetical protein